MKYLIAFLLGITNLFSQQQCKEDLYFQNAFFSPHVLCDGNKIKLGPDFEKLISTSDSSTSLYKESKKNKIIWSIFHAAGTGLLTYGILQYQKNNDFEPYMGAMLGSLGVIAIGIHFQIKSFNQLEKSIFIYNREK